MVCSFIYIQHGSHRIWAYGEAAPAHMYLGPTGCQVALTFGRLDYCQMRTLNHPRDPACQSPRIQALLI